LREDKTDTDSAVQDTLPDLRERTVELVKKNSPITLDWPAEYLHGCADCGTKIPENYTYCESCENNHPETDNGPSMDDGPWFDDLGVRTATPTRHPHDQQRHTSLPHDQQQPGHSPTRSNNPQGSPREKQLTHSPHDSDSQLTPPRQRQLPEIPYEE